MTQLSSQQKNCCLAYFVSSHGFGHAARASAVMQTLLSRHPEIRFVIFTQTPKWFFKETLSNRFEYINFQTDVGMVQQNPTREDFAATIKALGGFKSSFIQQSETLAAHLAKLNCKAALCDISPLGIAAARSADIPSFLIENFTWDWIYDNYQDKAKSALKPFSDFMRSLFAAATHRIQTEPVCHKVTADLCTSPVSRQTKTTRNETRSRLGILHDRPMVIITMGGVSTQYHFLKLLEKQSDIDFVIPSATHSQTSSKNLILLPEHSQYYHPDLIHASDAAIGKVGYSTLAEVFHAGLPFGYVARPAFPESAGLVAFIKTEMTGIEFEETGFYDGAWIKFLPDLFKFEKIRRRAENGAHQVADYIAQILNL